MIGGRKIALTRIGSCQRPGCNAPIFAELLTVAAPWLCIDCAPLSIERGEMRRSLFRRSGGRLPPGGARGATSDNL
jgi:hypothetical protein